MYIQQSTGIQAGSGVTSGRVSGRESVATNPVILSQKAATSGQSGTVNLSQESKSLASSKAVYSMETADGPRDVDLDSYFKPGAHLKNGLLDPGALLLPNASNVAALQQHISQRFPEFLARHDIPEAPATIRFDQQGQLVLSQDYPYAEQLQQALKGEPEMQRMLSTVNGLSSHVAALKSLQPMHDALDQAGSDAEVKSILERFSHLLGDNVQYPEVSLAFSADGKLTVQAGSQAGSRALV